MNLVLGWHGWVVLGVLGACVGSFLNVVIVRVPDPSLRFLSPARSFCPSCGSPVRARDNIPVASYLLLRGRCRDCGGSIGALYPVVELLGAGVAIVAVVRFGPGPEAIVAATFGWLLLVIAACDWRTMEIPLRFPLLGLAAAVGLAGYGGGGDAIAQVVGEAVGISTLLAAIAAAVGWSIGRPALGFADLLIVALLPALLGIGGAMAAVAYAAFGGLLWYASLAVRPGARPVALAAGAGLALLGVGVGGALLTAVQGGIVLSALGVRRSGTGPVELPFGTLMCAGALASLLVGEAGAQVVDALLPWQSRGVLSHIL